MIINNKEEICIDKIEIKDVIDMNLLQNFQDHFAESMDIASITVDRYGNPVTKPSSYTRFCSNYIHCSISGDKKCADCHRKAGEESAKLGGPYIYICHAGLIDFAAPIILEGVQIGTILGGQILIEKPEELRYIETARELDIEPDKLIEALKEIKIISEKNIKAAAEVLFLIANALSKIGYEEIKLKKLSKDLEDEVIKTNALLDEANKYNELKTKLFSTISHELKTPLNIIFSSVQLLEDYYNKKMLTDDRLFYKYSNIMKQNCYRLIRLIDNVIDMNKMGVGFFELNLKNNDIIKVIEDITISIAEFANRKKIKIIFDTDVEEKITACDSDKIERVMLNLLSNAIKFTDYGGMINVTIYDKENYILISVKDNGIGIPENMQDKIFETFTQVDSSLRRNFEGSGIGLSIVKSIVEMHKGEISVNSQLGIGSEFIIKLPIKLLEDHNNYLSDECLDLNQKLEKIKIQLSDINL